MKLQICAPTNYTNDFAIKAAFYLGIQNKRSLIDITFKRKLDEGVYGYCLGDKNFVEIQLARTIFGEKISRDIILKTLAHEMIHARQYINEDLRDPPDNRSEGYYVYWRGSRVLWKQEEDNPWEWEADALTNDVFKYCYK